jgi:hypothetical protein
MVYYFEGLFVAIGDHFFYLFCGDEKIWGETDFP